MELPPGSAGYGLEGLALGLRTVIGKPFLHVEADVRAAISDEGRRACGHDSSLSARDRELFGLPTLRQGAFRLGQPASPSQNLACSGVWRRVEDLTDIQAPCLAYPSEVGAGRSRERPMTGFDHVPSLDAALLEPEPAPVQSRYLAGRVSGMAAHKNAAAIKAAVARLRNPAQWPNV